MTFGRAMCRVGAPVDIAVPTLVDSSYPQDAAVLAIYGIYTGRRGVIEGWIGGTHYAWRSANDGGSTPLSMKTRGPKSDLLSRAQGGQITQPPLFHDAI